MQNRLHFRNYSGFLNIIFIINQLCALKISYNFSSQIITLQNVLIQYHDLGLSNLCLSSLLYLSQEDFVFLICSSLLGRKFKGVVIQLLEIFFFYVMFLIFGSLSGKIMIFVLCKLFFFFI